jgi:hypothetical protein
VELEQLETLVDRLDKSHTLCQRMEHADAATRDSVCLVGDFIVNVTGSEYGLESKSIACLIEAATNTLLAFIEPALENGFHLKSFCGRGVCEAATYQTPQNAEGFRAFSISPNFHS